MPFPESFNDGPIPEGRERMGTFGLFQSDLPECLQKSLSLG